MSLPAVLTPDSPGAAAGALALQSPPAVGMWVVFGIILVALVLFATEPVPVDITAIGVMVALL